MKNRISLITTPESTQRSQQPQIAVRLSKHADMFPQKKLKDQGTVSQGQQFVLPRPKDFAPDFFASSPVPSLVMPTYRVRIESDGYIKRKILRWKRRNGERDCSATKRILFIGGESPTEKFECTKDEKPTVPFKIHHKRTCSVPSSRAATARERSPFQPEFSRPEILSKVLRLKIGTAERMKFRRNLELLKTQPQFCFDRNTLKAKNRAESLKQILKPKGREVISPQQTAKRWYESKKWSMTNGYYQHNFTQDINKVLALSNGQITTVSSLFSRSRHEEERTRSAEKLVSRAKFGIEISPFS